jgi:hypothetical protein
MSQRAVPWWVWGVGLAGVGYVVYRLWSGVSKVGTGVTNAIAQGVANAWLSLPIVGLPAAMTVLGNVKLPDGTSVALSSLQNGQIRQDNTVNPPNVYANVSGTIYQLSPSDAQGNYPAALIGPAPAGA